MTPAEYVNEVVLPSMRDYTADRQSRRHTYQSCQAVFHIKDHLYQAGEQDVEDTMRAATGNWFDMVRGICNGSKHGKTSKNHFYQFQAEQDYVRPPGTAGELQAGLSQLGDVFGGRQVYVGGLAPTDIYHACKTVLFAFKDQYPQHLGGCDLTSL